MHSFLSNLKDLVSLPDADQYDDDLYEQQELNAEDYSSSYPQESSYSSNHTSSSRYRPTETSTHSPSPTARHSNVVGMLGANSGVSEVVVMEPQTFEEIPRAVQALRERKSIVINLANIEPEFAQRAIDFIAGASYAIDGHHERIGEGIFLFTPSCVNVVTPATLAAQASAQYLGQNSSPPFYQY